MFLTNIYWVQQDESEAYRTRKNGASSTAHSLHALDKIHMSLLSLQPNTKIKSCFPLNSTHFLTLELEFGRLAERLPSNS
jgi:hypothetical protein